MILQINTGWAQVSELEQLPIEKSEKRLACKLHTFQAAVVEVGEHLPHNGEGEDPQFLQFVEFRR